MMADQTEKRDDRNGLDSPKKSDSSSSSIGSNGSSGSGARTEDYKFLIDYGLDTKVAGRLDDIYKTGDL